MMMSTSLVLYLLCVCAINGYMKPSGRSFVQRLYSSTSTPPPVSFNFLNKRYPLNHRDISNESSTITITELENPFETASLRKLLDILLLQGSIAACKYEYIYDDKISAYWIDGYFHSLPVYIQSSTYLKEMFHLKDIRIPITNENIKSKSVNVIEDNMILNNNIELSHVIHPKSICKRLFQLRDSMCETYLEDLSIISLENRYLKRISLTGDTRKTTEENRLSSPIIPNNRNNILNSNRDDNFNRLNQLITVMTLNIFRRHLTDVSHVTYLNHIIETTKRRYVVKDTNGNSNATTVVDMFHEFYLECDTFYNTTMTPRDLLIELYNEGERKGLERNDDGTYINKLTIARDIITLREAIVDFVGYLLNEKQRENKKNFREVRKDAINIKYSIDDTYDIVPASCWDLQIMSNSIELIAWKQGFKCGELAAQTILLRDDKDGGDNSNNNVDSSMIAIPSSAIHKEATATACAMIRQAVKNNENNDDIHPVFGAILM